MSDFNAQQNIEDFLNFVNFIAPKGYTLQYFITPNDGNNPYVVPAEANYAPESNANVIDGVTDTLLFKKKDMAALKDFSTSLFDVKEIPQTLPLTQKDQQQIIQTNQETVITSPAKLDRRVTATEYDTQIQESCSGFPAFTLFHFTKD